MLTRRNQILAIVLVVQLAVAAFVFWPRPSVSGGGQPLLPEFEASQVVRLEITAEDGETTELVKKDGGWVLGGSDDFPVDSDRVDPILEKLGNLRDNRMVTETEGSHRQLQVAEDSFVRRLEIDEEDGRSYLLYLGKSAGGGSIHVRKSTEAPVYLTSELTPWDLSAAEAAWIDTGYFRVPYTATVALRLENPQGVFEFVKEGDNWTMQGLEDEETLAEDEFNTMRSQAEAVTMLGPIGKTETDFFGMDEPQAVVVLSTQEGEAGKTYRHTLKIGAKITEEGDADQPGQSYYVAKSSDSDYYVRVSEYLGDLFVNKSREDFLAQPTSQE